MDEEKKILITDQTPTTKEKPELWKSAISIVAVLVIVFILIKMFIRMLIPVMAAILLFANRDLVMIIVKQIYKLYKDETYKGLIATALAVIGFIPFMVFLLGRSLYYMFVVKKNTEANTAKTKDSLTSDLISITIKEKVKSVLGIDEDEDKRQEDNKQR